jgi:RNA polymerase sigma-70 factor (ECF subfamily)
MVPQMYSDHLFSYAMGLARNHSDAEDLVQETYVRALRAAKHLRHEGNIRAWLFTILRNIWFNQHRQRRSQPTLVELDVNGGTGNLAVDTTQDPYAQYVGRVEVRQIREAIGRLSVELQEIILLREYEGLSYQELSHILDCPIGTVMSRLARARSKLRELVLLGTR